MVNTNVLYCGDCLTILKGFPDESIDLIYLDPPFFSNRHYEVLWGNGAELRAFSDRWKGGINHYIGWMEERLEQCKRVLKKTGSIYLHCDYHAGHYLKVMMDKIFGYNNFQNEIVWCYSIGGKSKKTFGRKHDTIFFYTKNANAKYTFNEKDIRISRKPATHMKLGVDSEGRQYQEKRDAKTGKIYRYYIDEGKVPEDYWTDIETLNREDKERLGYPTQKPEALMERIIKASSNKDDIVLDPMMGGGTTPAVAHKLDRRWIGIDVSPVACKLTRKRLKSLGVKDVVVLGLPNSISDLKKLPHFEFQNWVCKQLNGKISDKKSSDMGIDGWILGTIPIQVKQSDDVGRNPIDNFAWAISRAGKKKGVFVAFSYGKGAYEEVARAKLQNHVEIKLITVGDMLKADFNPMTLFS